MQGDPYGTQSGAYGLAHLIHQYLTSGMRYEPTVSGETAHAAGTQGVDQAMDQVMTEQWQNRMRAAREGQKAVGEAMSKVKRSPKADKQATQDWINKMRAAKEGQKAVGKELGKPPPPDPNDLHERIETQRENLMRSFPGFAPTDPRTGPAGEDAVRKALTDINMKPLIDHAMAVQEAQARADAIRQMIEAMRNQPPPELPESQIPENTNRPPGSENSYVTAHDYSMLPEGGGVRGVGFPPLRPPQMPPPANPPSISVVPGAAPSLIFGPRRTNPDQPHFPVGIDPNLTPPQPPVE